MFTDAALTLSSAQAISSTAASTSVYDVFGLGSGTLATSAYIVGTDTTPGAEIGATINKPSADFTVTTAGSGSGTITIALQGAPDDGSGNAGTYVTLSSTGPITGSTLTLGSRIVLPAPASYPITSGMGQPRFYRFYYTVASTASVSLTGSLVLNPALGYLTTQLPNNFTAA